MKVLIIGESCKDVYRYGECARLCPSAPVPVFKSINSVETGGMAKNVELNLKSLGVSTELVTNDNWAQITKTRFVDLQSNHMFLRVDKNDDCYGTLTEEKINNFNFSNFDAVVVSDYNKGFLTEDILKIIPDFHVNVFLDTKKILGSWASNYSFIKINNKEFNETKHTITSQLSNKLIITRGPRGCEFQGKIYKVPSVEVKDTSGAGDTFLSGLVKKFIETKSIDDSIKFANKCATIAVQKRGTSTL